MLWGCPTPWGPQTQTPHVPLLPRVYEWGWHRAAGGCSHYPPPPVLGASTLQEVFGQGILLEINCVVDSQTLKCPNISTWALLGTGSPLIRLRAGCRAVSVIGAAFVLLRVFFSSAPITLGLTPKQTSPGTRRYLPGSDRLVPRPGPGADKGPAVSLPRSLGLHSVTRFLPTINHWGAGSIN